MDTKYIPDNPYLLLTPGPLSTTKTVKAVMLKDWCTWDDDYKTLVEDLRTKLLALSTKNTGEYTTVLMQGSGTFSVESIIGSAIPPGGKLLVLVNGAYGERIALTAKTLKIDTIVHDSGELARPDLEKLETTLKEDREITHVAVVHGETTTGMLNPIDMIGKIVKRYGKIYFTDTISTFAGIPMDISELNIDFCVGSANKCIQGVPGFGFIVARTEELRKIKGYARSLSLDLYDQWQVMEADKGKWRFTSPTHIVRAFYQAMLELEEEGGIEKRHERYSTNQKTLVEGMRKLGFKTLLPDEYQSPIITSFYSPVSEKYNFREFYNRLKAKGFVIYPGKVTKLDTFRIGNIGDIYPDDIRRLLTVIEESVFW
ncbi:MAG TPA: 2-aminoethylphosphonate--pyruvate transaminase [Syntrophales bacterium]|nr:2-aminoethylphosphonate--pyruvate transaminase [Syntrophales bacterium]HPQ44542.1 2-aminoethylphosphonate--pyruvate transaminase [Syntrophales bacterium]